MSTENKTKSQIAKEFLEQNPNANPEEIAKASGMTAGSAKHWWYEQKKKANPKKKPKRKAMEKPQPINEQPKNLVAQIEYLQKVISRLDLELDALSDENRNLRYQVTGYDAVIDFLWTKIKEL